MDSEEPKVKRRVGRPLKFEDITALQASIDEYFTNTKEADWLITGLAVHLETSRNTLMEYEGRPEFVNAIKGAKDKIEMAYERDLRTKGNSGSIFGLKNFGWTDKSEVESTFTGDLTSNGQTIGNPEVIAGFAAYLKDKSAS